MDQHYLLDSLRAQGYNVRIMNRLTLNKRAQVVNALVEGNSIRATVRLTGVCKDAVIKLIRDFGKTCADHHNRAVRNVHSRRVQCDEAWSFCYAKATNVPEEKLGTGAGDVWTWTAIDADSKLVLSYLCGGRSAEWGYKFMEDLASRVSSRIQITTDGHRVYAEAVEGAFGMDVDYAMLIKVYGNDAAPDTRYSPAECIGIRTAVLAGRPDPRHMLDECLLQEIRESLSHGRNLFRVLQFLPHPPDTQGYASDGGRISRPRLES
ncbi:MAG: hypothetical protein WBF06_13825 [Candidatus Acidiferrales bacterium]